jgi:hypothetical protein
VRFVVLHVSGSKPVAGHVESTLHRWPLPGKGEQTPRQSQASNRNRTLTIINRLLMANGFGCAAVDG